MRQRIVLQSSRVEFQAEGFPVAAVRLVHVLAQPGGAPDFQRQFVLEHLRFRRIGDQLRELAEQQLDPSEAGSLVMPLMLLSSE